MRAMSNLPSPLTSQRLRWPALKRNTALLIAAPLLLTGTLWPSFSEAAPAIGATATGIPTAASAANSKAVQDADYLLDVEDIIGVVVLKHPELSADAISVSRSGKINLPVAGEITVSKKTVRQVQQEVTKRLGKLLRKPQVTVTLKQARPQRFFVTGAIARPSFYDNQAGWRVSEALTAAGGLSGPLEDSSATLSREGQQPITIDLAQIYADPASQANLSIQTGDVLTIQVAPPRRVMVSGEVNQPNTLDLRKAPRVLDALGSAGWLKYKDVSSRVYIIRKGEKIAVNLIDAQKDKDSAANPPLQADDTVMVEKIPATVWVNGQVKTPGPHEFEPGTGVLEAIGLSGGTLLPPDKLVVTVRRGAQNLPVDLARISYDSTANIPLQHNDSLLINEVATIKVQMTGSIGKAGTISLPPDAALLDALTQSGGITIPREEARINILRNVGNKQITLKADPVALLGLTDLSQNVKLQDGDTITVVQPKAETVFVVGEVAKPGPYDLKEGEGLVEVIARAGGEVATSSLRSVRVTDRAGEAKVYDLSAIRRGEKPSVPLESGDYITIPRNSAQVTVLEAVGRPGPIPIPEDRVLTLGDALGAAGGTIPTAKTGSISIVRQVNGQVQQQPVALNAVYNGVPASQMPLQNGDVIFVPGTKTKSNWLNMVAPFLFLFR